MIREHYLNADFDLSLRPRWHPPAGGAARRRITDLAWHGLFLADPGESVVVFEPVPADFTVELERIGLATPALTVAPECRPENRLAPFGWNAEAARRNRRHRRPVDHPELEAVARVNGRRFQIELEHQLGDADAAGTVIGSEAELKRALRRDRPPADGWVVKAEHGNAGLGNRRLRSPNLGPSDAGIVRRWLEEDEVVVLERWRPRRRDLSATFVVTADARVVDFELHETVTTADGALIGALFEADPRPLERWRDAMADAATTIGARLVAEGYSGPVCIDGMIWDDAGRPVLRRLVDLNARRAMSAGAARLWHRLGRPGAALWRFFNRRKLDLPDSYRAFSRALGDDAFDPDRRRGVLATAPMWLGPRRRSPDKIAMMLVGRDRSEALALERRVRAVFER